MVVVQPSAYEWGARYNGIASVGSTCARTYTGQMHIREHVAIEERAGRGRELCAGERDSLAAVLGTAVWSDSQRGLVDVCLGVGRGAQ